MARDIKSARLSDGLKLPHVELGEDAGVPMVFLHAFADSWRSFERLLPHLPASVHAFAVTQRGHGDADRPDSGYGVEEFAADVASFMDAVGLEAAVLLASSSAGFTVQRFAAEHPERTLGIVLIGAPWSLRDRPAVSEFFDAVSKLSDPIDPDFVREFVGGQPVPPRPADLPGNAHRREPQGACARLEGDTPGPAGGGRAGRDRHDHRAHPHPLGGSRRVPPAQRPGCARRGDLRIAARGLRRPGHAVHWEEPERVAADVAALAQRLRPNGNRRSPGR